MSTFDELLEGQVLVKVKRMYSAPTDIPHSHRHIQPGREDHRARQKTWIKSVESELKTPEQIERDRLIKMKHELHD
jgi:hypothetical protein